MPMRSESPSSSGRALGINELALLLLLLSRVVVEGFFFTGPRSVDHLKDVRGLQPPRPFLLQTSTSLGGASATSVDGLLRDESADVTNGDSRSISVAGPTTEGKCSGRILQVITDIDDTVKSSGGLRLLGVALGGIDTQYKRGQYYPGAFQFALELSRFGVPEGRDPARVAVLTARAREFKFALELKPSHKVCRTYAAAGVDNGVDGWGVGTVLYGSVKEWVCQGRKGLRKFRNFEALRREDRFDLTDYVFVGDTGELDVQAGESMIRKYPTRIKALFMHYVSEARPSPPPPRDRSLLDVPVIYFQTYVGAAVKAAGLGLLDRRGVEAVIARALDELEGGGKKGEKKGGRKATPEQLADLMADIDLAKRTVLMTKEENGGTGKGKREGGAEEVLVLLRKLFRPPDVIVPGRIRVRK
ncbi:Hypothetical protein NocV09_00203300 [Nannochloropsis oceanica]